MSIPDPVGTLGGEECFARLAMEEDEEDDARDLEGEAGGRLLVRGGGDSEGGVRGAGEGEGGGRLETDEAETGNVVGRSNVGRFGAVRGGVAGVGDGVGAVEEDGAAKALALNLDMRLESIE